jgi:hypothetical protein
LYIENFSMEETLLVDIANEEDANDARISFKKHEF